MSTEIRHWKPGFKIVFRLILNPLRMNCAENRKHFTFSQIIVHVTLEFVVPMRLSTI